MLANIGELFSKKTLPRLGSLLICSPDILLFNNFVALVKFKSFMQIHSLSYYET